jgi:hypothetical protein
LLGAQFPTNLFTLADPPLPDLKILQMPLSLRLFVGGLPTDHKNLGHITSAWSLFKKTMGGTNISPF